MSANRTVEQVSDAPKAEQIAKRMIELGAHVIFIPFGKKGANTSGWQNLATNEFAIAKALIASDRMNVGVVGKRDGLWFFDDDQNVLSEYEAQHGPIQTYGTRTVSGGRHLFFRQNDASWSMGNISGKDGQGRETWSARVNDRYVLAPWSAAHPDNDESKPLTFYEAIDKNLPVIEAPQTLLDFLKEKAAKSVSAKTSVAQDGKIREGGRNSTLASILGKVRQERGYNVEELIEYGLQKNLELFEPPLDDEEVKQTARSIARYAVKPTNVVLFNGKLQQERSSAPVPAASATPVEFPEYAMTEDEIEAELDKEYPRIMLATLPGPTWDDSILYGPAGQLTRAMAEYNEGHPAGIYLNLLVSLGNAFGRGASFRVNQTKHYTNEFLANVGQSSYGRKGSARDAVNEFMRLVDPEWSKERTLSGFGSGEAIIYSIRDSFEQSIPVKGDKKGAAPKFEKIVVPGVDDKRLCIRESELASIFTMASKTESLAGAILRNGWDGNPLSNNVKGTSKAGISNSARCENPHVSITGDISREELKSSLPQGSENNGFGNRFLFCYVHRTKKCPNGGPDVDFGPWLVHFHAVIEHAKKVGVVPLSKAAEKVWARMYLSFDEAAKRDDLTAKMTSRGAAHVRRLATILALIDLDTEVQTEHLHAARAIWNYCEESARYIFQGTTLDQMKLLAWVRESGPVTAGQVRRKLYHDNREAGWVRAQLLDLVKQGRLAVDGENFLAKS
jgi:uncharacterized protein DUF3987/primase-like protein/bifunctional DNA primase/polymerase-like protein